MPDDTICRIRVSYSSYIIYDATTQMKSGEKSVQIRSTIFKNSEAKKEKFQSNYISYKNMKGNPKIIQTKI